eukprot:TRINITY_DN4982_c0_g2_i1.p1 TRINITY_DN4982_c0_g2~~TRINITY_DN4982_c0_g2_i1.p1  ORF type:complete len:166 (+),score=25.25 TRINITY_DN4982_c0_g2_i1:176-673(+)
MESEARDADPRLKMKKEINTRQCRRASTNWRCPFPVYANRRFCKKHFLQSLRYTEKQKKIREAPSAKAEGKKESKSPGSERCSGTPDAVAEISSACYNKPTNSAQNSAKKSKLKKKKCDEKELQWPLHLAPLEGVCLDLPNGVMVIPPLVGSDLTNALRKFGVRR